MYVPPDFVPPIEADPAEELRNLLDDLLACAERDGAVHVSVTMTRGNMTLSEARTALRQRERWNRSPGLRGLVRRWIVGAR
ncbi:hypothetical protein ACOKM5_44260 [Streptomyces sp. BH097]|uniref:hypothetical protein n=1 Tax=Streptomyces sp. BH097 TaxID=3410406 RepID=UPI003CED49E5